MQSKSFFEQVLIVSGKQSGYFLMLHIINIKIKDISVKAEKLARDMFGNVFQIENFFVCVQSREIRWS